MSDATDLFGLHAAALPLREQRLKLLAANLANADTPHYKAVDIDFATALRRAAAGGAEAALPAPVLWRVPTQPSLDGNTVETDVEQAAFGRAALEYRVSLSLLEGRIRSLLTAITGQ